MTSVDQNKSPAGLGAGGRISLRELADGAARVPVLDETGQVTGPLTLVDLGGRTDPVLLNEAREAALGCERILVGMRAGESLEPPWLELAAALDLTLTPADRGQGARQCVATRDPEQAAGALQVAAAANPQAALCLAQVLRAGESLDARSALHVESFAYSTLLSGAEFRRWLAGRQRRPVVPGGPEPAVTVNRVGDSLRVALNRPARRNAYSREVRDALVDALLVAVLDDRVVRVTLSGAGPSFCSGGDLDEFGTTPDPATAHFIRTGAGAPDLLRQLSGRTEALVHGACVGAGVELPAFAGRVIASPGTTFRLPETAMGLIPGAGGTVSIPRRIGRWRTLYLALSAQPLDVATAVDWGLVDQIAALRLLQTAQVGCPGSWVPRLSGPTRNYPAPAPHPLRTRDRTTARERGHLVDGTT